MAQRLASLGTKIVTKSASSAQNFARFAQPHLSRFWGHARVELGPPGPTQWPEIRSGLGQLWNSAVSGKFLDIPARQAAQNTLVAVEVACWFFVGEMIGRKHIIGYRFPAEH